MENKKMETKKVKTPKKTSVKASTRSSDTTVKKATTTSQNQSDAKNITTESKITPIKKLPFRLNFKIVVLIVMLSAVAYFVNKYKNEFIIVTVNGKPITRIELDKELEKQGGNQTLDILITQTLIKQDALRNGVVVDEVAVQSDLSEIENNITAQGMKLEDALKMQNITKDYLLEQLRMQQILTKLATGNVTVTEQEVNDMIASAVESGEEDTPELRASAEAQLKQMKENEAISTYLDNLRKSADIKVLNDKFSLPEKL